VALACFLLYVYLLALWEEENRKRDALHDKEDMTNALAPQTTPGRTGIMSKYQSTFKSTAKNIAKARADVRKHAAQLFSGQELADIESAVGEALSNSAEHGAGSDGEIELRCYVERREFVIEVKDSGPGFESWSATDATRPLASAERGYGIFIMRELMDSISYSENGSRLRLMKRLPQ